MRPVHYLYTWQQLHDLLQLAFPGIAAERLDLASSYSVAPMQSAPIVSFADEQLWVRRARWSLRTLWAKDMKLATFNARVETAPTSAMFRSAFKAQ